MSDIDWLGETDVAPEHSAVSMKNITLNIVTIVVSTAFTSRFRQKNDN